jgi:NADH:ubiquinone reductase (H+-translocating)
MVDHMGDPQLRTAPVGATDRRRPRVVVVGAGFGGLAVARRLSREPVDVVLVDRRNFHTFQPLLYQVATAEVGAEEVAHPVRAAHRRRPAVGFRLGTVTGLDRDQRLLLFDEGDPLPFDHLVLAAGVVTDFGDVPGVRDEAIGLKSLADALRIRAKVLRHFERVEAGLEDVDDGALNVVVVGGGPTGVEMAGALMELFSGSLAQDLPELAAQARVVLLDKADRLLPELHPRSSRIAERALRDRGVEVLLGEQVSSVNQAVHLVSGTVIPCGTVIWAAGVRAAPIADSLGLTQDERGRVIVDAELRVTDPDLPGVYAIGDMAATPWRDKRPHPLVAQVAMQGGKHVARNILRDIAGQPARRFRYQDRGTMATIGRHAAVVELPIAFRFGGVLAWLTWLFIHLVYLIGLGNRVNVLSNWAWHYLTGDRAERLIVDVVPD